MNESHPREDAKARSGRRAVYGVVFVILALGFAQRAGYFRPAPIPEGAEVKDFTLPQLGAGATVSLAALRGRPVFINFWASFCGPCREELPAIERVHRAHPVDQVAILTVTSDDVTEIARMVRALDLTVPVLFDRDGKVHRAYGVTSIPLSVLLGADGRVFKSYLGVVTEQELERDIAAAMVGAP